MRFFLSKEEAVNRLCDTFRPKAIDEKTDRRLRVEVLMRFILAIDAAARVVEKGEGLTFSGEKPNNHDALGNYLISGGRIFFDLSELLSEDKKKFEKFLFTDEIEQHVIYQRLAATHQVDISQYNNNKFVYEKKLSPLQSLLNAIKQLFGRIKPSHFAMDIGIGGYGNKVKTVTGEEVTIRNNGEFGHLYINKPPGLDAIQMGFEEAAPGRKFVVGGGWHGPDGKGCEYTACMRPHLKNEQFGPNGQDHIIPREDKNAAYAWNTVKMTKQVVEALAGAKIDPENESQVMEIQEILKKPPYNATPVADYDKRNKKILKYRKEHGLLASIFSKEDASQGLSNILKKQGLFSTAEHVTQFYSYLMEQSQCPFAEKIITLAILQPRNPNENLKNEISRALGLPIEKLRQKIAKSMVVDLKLMYADKKERLVRIKAVRQLLSDIQIHADRCDQTGVQKNVADATVNKAVEGALKQIQALSLLPERLPCQQVYKTL